MAQPLRLVLLDDTFAIVRFPPAAAVPAWASASSDFVTITRTLDELSIVAADRLVPETVNGERDFRALKVVGPLAFGEVGILASIASALAAEGVSIFVVSTYDTDYVLLKSVRLNMAAVALRQAGYIVSMKGDEPSPVRSQ